MAISTFSLASEGQFICLSQNTFCCTRFQLRTKSPSSFNLSFQSFPCASHKSSSQLKWTETLMGHKTPRSPTKKQPCNKERFCPFKKRFQHFTFQHQFLKALNRSPSPSSKSFCFPSFTPTSSLGTCPSSSPLLSSTPASSAILPINASTSPWPSTPTC
jgi:hypothetical protein